MALIQVSVVPIGTSTTSIGDSIPEAVRVLERAQVPYELSAMGTSFEAPLKQGLVLAQRMHEAAFRTGVARVLSTITIDDRRDKEVTLKSKVASVRRRLRQQSKEA
jgi:uncharacterized protein (TIGR00106 family)